MTIPMDTLILVTIVVIARYFLYLMREPVDQDSKFAWIVVILVTMVLCASPLILIKKEIIENSVINLLVAGFSFFYFPFVVGRMNQ